MYSVEKNMAEIFERGQQRITLIDLSDCLENATVAFEPNPHSITYMTSEQSAAAAEQSFGLGPAFWPDGQGWAVEQVTLTTHSGTHVDAPAHYGPARHGQARTIDQVPLRWCFSDGVVLNMTHKHSGEGITRAGVQAELARIDYTLKPYDIVLVRTDTSKYFKQPGYDMKHAGLTREATEWMVVHSLSGADLPWSLPGFADVKWRWPWVSPGEELFRSARRLACSCGLVLCRPRRGQWRSLLVVLSDCLFF